MKNLAREHHKKILVVEDEAPLLRILADELAREGFAVSEAKNGEEGLKRAYETRPDLILLDIMMPKMDGMTMLRELRKYPWGQAPEVIIMTNLSALEKTQQNASMHQHEFLIKTNTRLQDIVKRVKEKIAIEPPRRFTS